MTQRFIAQDRGGTRLTLVGYPAHEAAGAASGGGPPGSDTLLRQPWMDEAVWAERAITAFDAAQAALAASAALDADAPAP